MLNRCNWLNEKNALYVKYHDKEWGVPIHNDRKLFESLILEGAQAGLSWETILNKRENYRKAFDDFDFNKIAKYDKKRVNTLLKNEGIVRNKLKIISVVQNAKVFIDIRKEFKTFDKYMWSFVENKKGSMKIAEIISKDLKNRGMNFVGPTIIYAFMQAVGMVNDHDRSCFRYEEIKTRHR